MPSRYRLSRNDFLEIQRRPSRRETSPLFSVAVTKNDVGHPRVGIVISKKIAALAVNRNKIERRTKTVLRGALPAIPDSYDFIFHARKPVGVATAKEIEHDVLGLFKKLVSVLASRERQDRSTMPRQ